MVSWGDFLWLVTGAIFIGAPVGGIIAATNSWHSDEERRDSDRNTLSLGGHPTPAPWQYHRLTRRIMASSVLILDTARPGPVIADGHGLTPHYKDQLGMMVCQSVDPDDGQLIAAAPKLLELAESLLRLDSGNREDDLGRIKLSARELVASVRGQIPDNTSQ